MTSEVFVHVRHGDGATDLVGRYRLVRTEARDIVASLVARMRSWREDFIADGVDAATVERLRRAFSKDLDHPPVREPARPT